MPGFLEYQSLNAGDISWQNFMSSLWITTADFMAEFWMCCFLAACEN